MNDARLILIRHGESVANVAAAAAEMAGQHTINAGFPDSEVPLSRLGEHQSDALGRWLASGAIEPLGSIWASSYLRAQQTISRALKVAQVSTVIGVDERLRDRELGILDLLTTAGVLANYPAEAERRHWLGKFYYRPPGGESWADVALRLRSFLRDINVVDAAGPVVIATHDAVVMVFIYVCLGLTEPELADFITGHVVTNASVTQLTRSHSGRWSLESFAADEHLAGSGVPGTEHAGYETSEMPPAVRSRNA
jgi:broad specificity phosphatase PhoE